MVINENASGPQSENSTLSTDLHVYPMLLEGTVTYFGIWPLIVSFGIFGNIATLMVLFKVKDGSTTSIYLKSLAVADLFTLGVKAICIIVYGWMLYRLEEYLTWKVNVFSFATLAYFSEKVSKYITVAVLFERIVAVMRPLRVRDICTPKRTVIVIALINIFAMFVSFPISIDIFTYFHTSESITYDEYPTLVREGDRYFISRMNKSGLLLLVGKLNKVVDLIPIPMIIISNIVIIVGLRNGNLVNFFPTDYRIQRQRQERQITKLCLTISFTFLFLCGPLDMYFLLYLTETIPVNTTTELVGIVVATLSMMNSSVNFIIYAVVSTKYRQEYLALLTCNRRTSASIEQS